MMQDAQSDVILYWGPRNRNRFNDIFDDIEYALLGIVTRWPVEHSDEMEVVEYILKDTERGIIWSVERGNYIT